MDSDKHADIEKLIAKYARAAGAHGRGTVEGNSRLANRNYDKIIDALRELDQQSTDGRKVLRRLYFHQDPAVRVWAATHLIEMDTEGAVRVLREVAEHSGMIGFGAEMVLKEWEAGRLKIPGAGKVSSYVLVPRPGSVRP